MPVDTEQLTADLDFLRSSPGWASGDETQRRELARQVAIESASAQDPEQHQALVSALWEEADPRGWASKALDFAGTAVKEVVASAAATGPAAVFAASDAIGLTNTGSGTRLARGVADLGNAAVQTAKQAAPNDYQQQLGDTLDALREDIHSNTLPVGVTRWLSGDETAVNDEEAKPWIEALTNGLADKAAKADTRLQLNPGMRKDSVKTVSEDELRQSWLRSDRNPANMGVQDDQTSMNTRDFLADYLVTRDPSSWQQFVNRVTETESQHKTRVARSLSGERQADAITAQMGVMGDLANRGMDMQTSPIDMATAALPLLRGTRLLRATMAGAEAGSVGGRIAMGAGKEALQEGVTQKLQDARASNADVLEAAAMGAIGSGAIEGGMAGTGALLRENRSASETGNSSPGGAPGSTAPGGTSSSASTPRGSGAQAGAGPTAPGSSGASNASTGGARASANTTTPGDQTNGNGSATGGQGTQTSGNAASNAPQWQPQSVRRVHGQPAPQRLPAPGQTSAQVPYRGVDVEGVGTSFDPTNKRTRPVIPDSPLGGLDILDYVNENPIALPRKGTAEGGDMDWQERYSLPKYYRQFLGHESGRGIDQVAQSAYEANLIPEPSPDALMNAVESAIQTRKQYRFEQRSQKARMLDEEKRVVRFEGAQAKLQGKADVVPFDAMQIGDELTVAGEVMKVKNLTYDQDGYPQTITMEDGKKFGLLSFDANRQNGVLVDEFRPVPRQSSGDFLEPEDMPGVNPTMQPGLATPVPPASTGPAVQPGQSLQESGLRDVQGGALGVEELGQSVQSQGMAASPDQAAQTPSSSPGGLTEAEAAKRFNELLEEQLQRFGYEEPIALDKTGMVAYSDGDEVANASKANGRFVEVRDKDDNEIDRFDTWEEARDELQRLRDSHAEKQASAVAFGLFRDELVESFEPPSGWELDDTEVSPWGSIYLMLSGPDGEGVKISLRDHDVQMQHMQRFGGKHNVPDHIVMLPNGYADNNDFKAIFKGLQNAYQWLEAKNPVQSESRASAAEVQGTIRMVNGAEKTPTSIPSVNSFNPSASTVGAEEFSRTATASAFARASLGDDAAFEDLDAMLRARYGQGQPVSSAEELARQVFTQAAFEQVFEAAYAAKDFDTILDAMKQSDRAVYAPLLKRFFAEQADNPESAMKADWMRHVFNGPRPPNAVAQQQGAGSTGQGAATQAPPRQASAPPPQQTPPPPKAGSQSPPSPPPPAPRIPVNPIRGKLAKSPYQIINDYSAAIGKLFQVRRLKPSQLGVYRPGSTMTANRFAGDLDTAAHELAGHWTDDKHGLGKPWMNDKTSPYDAELANFWIHGSPSTNPKIQRAEGIAEWLRAYVMDPQAAIASAPKFAAYVQKTLPADAMKALNAFSDDVRAWAGENPLRRSSLNIRMERPSVKERLHRALFGDGREFSKSWIDEMAARFSDNYHYAVKGFETALKMQGRSIKSLKPSENFELLVRWLSGHDNRFSEQLENGLTPLNVTQVTNAQGKQEVKRLTDPATGEPMNLAWLLGAFDNSSKEAQDRDARETSALMVAERTMERGRQIDAEAQAKITPATSAKERAAIIAEAEMAKRKLSGLGAGMMTDVQAANETLAALNQDPNKARRLREAARRYRAWADANLELLVEGGRMSRQQVNDIKAANTQYVDMHRLSEEFEIESLVAQSKGGSLGSAKDVMKKFKGSTLEIDNVYASLLKQTESIQKEVSRNRVMQTFVQQLESARTLYDGAPVELDRIGSRAMAEDRNTITVYRQGKAEYWKLDKDIHAAIKGFGELGSNELLSQIAKITGVIRYVITRSPGFAIRNPLRDTISRSVVSDSGARPWDILGGYTEADKQRMRAFGGGMFGHYGKDRYAWTKEMERGMKELRKDPRNILMAPLELWKGWERLLESSETLGRVAEFRKAYDKGVKELGYSPDEAALYAASEARGLIDFAKMGTWMRQINQVIPFSNAAVRGLARSASAAIKDPVGFGIRWTLFVAMPTIAVRLLAKQMGGDVEDEYQQLPAWQRDFFWNIKVGNYWLRIPKPHELGVMAGGVERLLSRELGEKNSFDGFGGSVSKALVVVDDFPSLLGPLKPFAEIAFNRDTFRDRDIVPIWERDLKLELRKGAVNASMVGQAVGKMIGADPRNIDYVLTSFGGLGTSLIDFTKPERRLGESAVKATGFVLPPISSQAKDYQWVVDWAKANGKLTDRNIKALRDLSSQVYQAKTPQEADDLAKLVRQRATAIREQITGR